ncbi:hypothetical protein [Arthrobacter cavernae]|uniref:Uncharacterized protein n=1 Tax=Arthrobacter cavernae TaxID=2817681 RepID=A0A939HJ02_9MICC|nr:hypothetical protein [Arthrobacter cavernae]MBO1269118.1 hypothetical protein [Arthrobacter cavernae]
MSYVPVHGEATGHTASPASTRLLVVLLTAAAIVAWSLSVWLAVTLRVEGPVHTVAQVVHILAMVLAFGAIMLVDWHGFLWLIRRRQLKEIIRLDGAATPLIWAGLAGMLASGVFLNPNLGNPLTVIKLVAVLLLIINGIMLIPLMRRLVKMSPASTFAGLQPGQRFHMLACLSISQLCWWTAIIVGFINAEFN